MEEYLIIIMRTLFLYIGITILFRLMGKREIGELSILDLVVFIMIAELAVVAIEDPKTPMLKQLLPMIILLGVQVLTAFISLKSERFRQVVDGQPTIIINKGKIDEAAMRKQRYNFDDLLLQLREKDVRDITEVDYAILESSGKLSVFTTESDREENDFTLPLVVDGAIQDGNLQVIGKDRNWLMSELKKNGYAKIDSISFCSFQNGSWFIDEKDEA
ncbi:DUF421 domain-containing protein [Bacillus carboniphilus]|uniref:DUF421 domain-containing protein n=1 Tax=Bacillus carboniphilus TaxID=86663 RepID=A0ABP3G355_9BACI